MNKLRLRSLLFCCLTSFCAYSQLQLLNDEFNDSTSLRNWNSINETEDWNIQQLEWYNINDSIAGKLQMAPYTATWYADYRGPLLYKEVSGDFVFTTKVDISGRQGGIPMGNGNYNLAGVMCRIPRNYPNGALGAGGWQAGDQNYVFLSIGAANNGDNRCDPNPNPCLAPHLEVKTTNNSNSNLDIQDIDTTAAQLRFARIGQVFIVMYRLETDQEWIVHRRYERPDFPSTTQLGFVTYTNWRKVFTYTPAFHNSHTLNENLMPDPSSDPRLAFTPDVIGDFEFARFDSLAIPPELVGSNFADPNNVSDLQLLSFLGYVSTAYCPNLFYVQEVIDSNEFVQIQANDKARFDTTIQNNAIVLATAGNQVSLLSGFHAENGASFSVSIATCASFTQPLFIQQSNSTNTNKKLEVALPQMSLHPNPAQYSTNIKLQLAIPSRATLGLYNQNGQLIRLIYDQTLFEQGIHELELNMLELKSGMYFIRLQTERSIISRKLLIVAQ